MSHKILITGASGYLGGSFLAHLSKAQLPLDGKLYALVRTDAQAHAVRSYGAQPLTFDTSDELSVRDAVVGQEITIVYFLIDAISSVGQVNFIRALAEVRQVTGRDVHFLHTSGAKIFSSHAGAPTDRPLLDTDPELYDIQKAQRSSFPPMQQAVETNCTVIEQGEKYGVRSYIFTPCIVYGKGEGFGNPVSIQTVAIMKAAKALGRVYRVDDGAPSWPVCHISDNSGLYLHLLEKILARENLDHGKHGYYLASSGSVAWDDIYQAMATALLKRGAVIDDSITRADDDALRKMGIALDGSPKDFVPVLLGGHCTLAARHAEEIGWTPRFSARHILEAADEEVDGILRHLV